MINKAAVVTIYSWPRPALAKINLQIIILQKSFIINKIAEESFKSLPNLTRVELQNNNLVTLPSEAVITSNSGKYFYKILSSGLFIVMYSI